MMFPRSLPFWLLMGKCYWKRYDGEYPWGNSVSNYLAHLNCKLVDLSCMPVVQLQPRGWFEPKYAQNILWKDIKFATTKKKLIGGGGWWRIKKKWKYGGVFKNITSNCIRDAINYNKVSCYCVDFELFKTCHFLRQDQKNVVPREILRST